MEFAFLLNNKNTFDTKEKSLNNSIIAFLIFDINKEENFLLIKKYFFLFFFLHIFYLNNYFFII